MESGWSKGIYWEHSEHIIGLTLVKVNVEERKIVR